MAVDRRRLFAAIDDYVVAYGGERPARGSANHERRLALCRILAALDDGEIVAMPGPATSIIPNPYPTGVQEARCRACGGVLGQCGGRGRSCQARR